MQSQLLCGWIQDVLQSSASKNKLWQEKPFLWEAVKGTSTPLPAVGEVLGIPHPCLSVAAIAGVVFQFTVSPGITYWLSDLLAAVWSSLS